jgi:sulfotransferase family protein
MPSPILVTGSHRSGTTWVGKMLARAPGVAYVHEPFNPRRGPGWIGQRLPYWYLYVCPENEDRYLPLLARVMELRYPLGRTLAGARGVRPVGQALLEWSGSLGLQGARPLLKDPIALFSAEWLADRFEARPVVLIRHPAAFAGSLKRLDWRFDFRNWSEQPLLLRDHLSPFGDEIRDFARRERDIVDQAVLLWNAIHQVIRGYRSRHPDWTFLKYEDLAADPVPGFLDLFAALDLPWTEGIRADIERFSSERNVKEVPPILHRRVKRDSRAAARTWLHRLTAEERARIREGTAAVAAEFYGEEEWAPAEAVR